MSILELRIEQPSLMTRSGDTYFAVADILPLDSSRGRAKPIRGVQVPIGGRSYARVSLVSPGHYLVRAKLPSGEIMLQRIEVGGRKTRVQMESEDSPHKWLSQEKVLGLVPSAAHIVKQAAMHGALEDAGSRSRQKSTKISRSRPAKAVEGTSTSPKPSGSRSAALFADRFDASGRASRAVDTVEALVRASLASLNYDASLAIAAFEVPTRSIFASMESDQVVLGDLLSGKGVSPSGDESAMYSVVEVPKKAQLERLHSVPTMLSQLQARRKAPGVRRPRAMRYYAILAERGRVSRACCVPVGWVSLNGNRESRIKLVFSRTPTGKTDMAIAVDDPKIASVLSFLQRGDLGSAKLLIKSSLRMLMEKAQNPMAAAAAAYVLIYSSEDTEPHANWRQWIRNLGARFPFVPDGLIQHATLLLQRGDPGAEEDARALLLRALDFGPPMYRLGVKLLAENLAIVRSGEMHRKHDNGVTAAALRYANWLAARVDTRHAFTVLNI